VADQLDADESGYILPRGPRPRRDLRSCTPDREANKALMGVDDGGNRKQCRLPLQDQWSANKKLDVVLRLLQGEERGAQL
jgi:hypothetical protein